MLVTNLKVITLFSNLTNNNKKEIKDFIDLTNLVFLILIIIGQATKAKNSPNVFLYIVPTLDTPPPPHTHTLSMLPRILYQIPSHVI